MSAFAIRDDISRQGDLILVQGGTAQRLRKVRRIKPGRMARFVDAQENVLEARCRQCGKNTLEFVICRQVTNANQASQVTFDLFIGLPAMATLSQILHGLGQFPVNEVLIFPAENSPWQLSIQDFSNKSLRMKSLITEGCVIGERFKQPNLSFWPNLRSILEGNVGQAQSIETQPPLVPRSLAYSAYVATTWYNEQNMDQLPLTPNDRSLGLMEYAAKRLGYSPNIEQSLPAIGLFLGPEGGWTDLELAKLKAAGIRPLTVGQSILQMENALFAVIGYVNGFLQAISESLNDKKLDNILKEQQRDADINNIKGQNHFYPGKKIISK